MLPHTTPSLLPPQQYPHTLLPTPPSSPPTIGMYSAESTISLLESLVAFYHQERMWVYRTRAQLEMDLLYQAPISYTDTRLDSELPDDSDTPTDSGKAADTSSPSPPTKWLKRKKAFNLRLEGISSARGMLPPVVRGGISKHPHPHTQHRARQSSNLNPASVPASQQQQSAMHASSSSSLRPHPVSSSNTAMSFYPPTAINTTTLTSPYLSYPSFQFSTTTAQQQSVNPASRYVSTPAQLTHTSNTTQPHPAHAGPLVLGASGREPTVQILEMFERMMQARMESCERMTRMVREANKPGSVVVGGVGVGGPVGGFGGPVGVGVPQSMVVQGEDMMTVCT